MSALIVLLKNNAEQNPNASYFNVDILKYQVSIDAANHYFIRFTKTNEVSAQIKPKPGAASCPLHLVAFWKCESQQTDLRIDYKYNSHAMESTQSEVQGINHKGDASSSGGAQLSQVCVAAPVDGGVKCMHSKPSGQWYD
jgi:hypothetical protein